MHFDPSRLASFSAAGRDIGAVEPFGFSGPLREAGYAAVQYIPRRDVDLTALARSDHATYCPYKGEASYFGIPIGGERSTNAVWTYETPFPAIAAIKDYVAFYPDRVDEIR